MKKFELAETLEKRKRAVDGIDCSILLAYVFGRPIKAEQAFMYLFRRYGLPNIGHDDLKDLCGYMFHTDKKGVVVRWHMNEGDYHFHLYAFADSIEYWKYEWKPIKKYHQRIQEAAEKDGLVYYGGQGIFGLFKWGKDGKGIFTGNKAQEEAIDKYWDTLPEGSDKEKWDKVEAFINSIDRQIKKKYSATVPYPIIESWITRKNLVWRYDNQAEAGKEQHEWIMSLRPGHFLRRVYFAAMRLFEDWKRPTYIRDRYFNLTCDEDVTDFGGRKGAGYTDFWEQIRERASKNSEASNAGV